MKRKTILAAILATAALALGSAGTAWAHEPVATADEQCGTQGDQTTPAVTTPPTTPPTPAAACGAEDNAQTGDQVETGEQVETGDQGKTADAQQGDQQEGEH